MVTIGTIHSVGHADNYTSTPDDRQTLVKTVTSTGAGSVTVEDYGVVDDGEIVSFTAVFSAADYSALVAIWKARTLSTVTFDDGTVWSNARVVIKGVSYFDSKLARYKKVQLEVWRV